MLPLEDRESLVDEREDIDPHRLALLLHLDRLVELLNRLLEVLLVKEKLAIVVVHIRHMLEVLHGPLERRHGRGYGSHLVLRHTQLDVREDEIAVQFDRLLIVLGSIGKLPEDEVKLGTVVVDIGVILVVGDGEFEVIRRSVLVTYAYISDDPTAKPCNSPSSRCKLARLI